MYGTLSWKICLAPSSYSAHRPFTAFVAQPLDLKLRHLMTVFTQGNFMTSTADAISSYDAGTTAVGVESFTGISITNIKENTTLI